MLKLTLELRNGELYCGSSHGKVGTTARRLDASAIERLKRWGKAYDEAVRSHRAEPLPGIGRDIALWLDEGTGWLSRGLDSTGEIVLEIAGGGTPDDAGRAVLDAPWEILAPDGVFLAADPHRLFRVERRLGNAGMPRPPLHRDLALVFMAADPEGEAPLNYEQEEAGILEATRLLDLNLVVEESGCLAFLAPCLAQERPEAVHLSCHGTIDGEEPVLALETPEGGRAPAGIDDLKRALGEEDQAPALVFLSACRTAEHGPAAAAYTQALVRSGVANAIGWDGSVYDGDAIDFAKTFYAELAKGGSVGYAAARARRDLLAAHLADPDRARGRHWHLARVYLGPSGGGPLCATGKPKRIFRKGAGYKEFLDAANRLVPVASAAEFVGRRRQAQQVLKAFREQRNAGVLIHGMGNLGKSSLAARIANRLPHHQPVVLHGRYHALAVFEALLRALPPAKAIDVKAAWEEAVGQDDRQLHGVLVDLLEGPLRCEDRRERTRPILLIVDDLEQILEQPKPGGAGATPVRPEYAPVLAAVIAAFRDARASDSRLLLTSRFTFALDDDRGDDLAARIARVPLPPMDEVQRDKQMRAAALHAAESGKHKTQRAPDPALAARIMAAAAGNPGLQEILARPLFAGDAAAAQAAVAAVEGYVESGEVPKEAGAAAEFFARVSLQAYREMLTESEAVALRASTLFSLPAPREALEAAIAAAGVGGAGTALVRLEGLGLVDLYVDGGGEAEAAVNPLARPLVEPLAQADRTHLAAAAVPPLWAAWQDEDGDAPFDPRGVALAGLAIEGGASAEILDAAALAGGRFLFDRLHAAHEALAAAAIAALEAQGARPGMHLLRLAAECAERIGDGDAQDRFLHTGMDIEGGEPRARAMLLADHAQRLIRKGELAAAESALAEVAATFAALGDVRSKAVAMGRIADILHARGQLDEALAIRRTEELPVYERLGDVRSLLVGRANMAINLLNRNAEGDREEAGRLLALALIDARRLLLPEAGQIEAILEQTGLAQGQGVREDNEERP